jgi:hypothetical protein
MSQHTYADEQVGAQQEGPITPYPEADGSGKTSGWSGSETSHERAVSEDADGTTSARQEMVYRHVAWWKETGVTVAKMRENTGLHHGQASSALSVLHKEGRIARLTERRDRCAVYVLPEYVNGRETAAPGRQARTPEPVTLTAEEALVLSNVRRNLAYGWSTTRKDVEALVGIIDRAVGRG